ncbi:MAG TPA: hypothetical protein PKG63_01300 [Bacteroidales bacterium]|jgi:hypothetical protein|nr:hypothetical protein [Bacteroidales bacterium]HOU97471.1 hypothetical protein [Bacteroidales bacterium]
MKQKYLSIFFLFIFVTSLFSSYLYFVFLQYKVKGEIEQVIKNKTFSFKEIKLFIYNDVKKDIYWYEPNHEFSYQNKMFDVVYIEKKDNVLTNIYAIEDKKETNVIFDFLKTTNHCSSLKFFNYFIYHFILELNDKIYFYHFTVLSKFYLNITFLYKNISLKLIVPPPKALTVF